MKPNEEQIKELWEWCGFRRLPEGKAGYHFEHCEKIMNWMQPDYKDSYKSMPYLPEIDLNNLFKWAVPKLYSELSKAGKYYRMKWLYEAIEEAVIDNKDPALALFWAIWEVIQNETEN